MITTHMHTKVLPLPNIPDATSADGTEAARRAAFASVMDDVDSLLGNNPREMLMCQLITLPGLLEVELRMHLSSSSTHVLSSRLDDVFAKLQPFLELYPLLRNGSVMLCQDCCVDVMKRYLIPYMDGFSPKSLKTMAQVVSMRQAAPYIDMMLVPTAGRDNKREQEEHTVEQVGEYWGSLEMASFIMDRKRYKDWVVSQNKPPTKPRFATLTRPVDYHDAPWESTLRTSVQADMLMPDKEISEILRMSQLAFASPTPHSHTLHEDSSSQFDAVPANRPWSAEPRAASRMDDERNRPRTANSFRYRNDDIFERGGTPEPARKLFHDGRRAVSRSSGGSRGPATTLRRPASVERPASAGPWLSGARKSGGGGFEARTLHRYRGVGEVTVSISEATEVTPDLRQTVQPFMKPLCYTTRPQELEKDWIWRDRTMKTRKARSRMSGGRWVDSSSQDSVANPNYPDPESEMDFLAEMLSDAFPQQSEKPRNNATSASPEAEIVWSGSNIREADISGYNEDRAKFEEKYNQAVAYEVAARKRVNAVMSHLRRENVRRSSQRKKREQQLTESWKREESPEVKSERRQRLHEKYLTLQKNDRKARHDFRDHVRTSYVKWDAIAEAERKEFEKLMKAAVASRPAFDAYEREVEMEQRRAQKKKEKEQKAAEPQEVLPDPHEVEAEKQRRQRHEEMLIKRYGMALSAEQVGAAAAVENLKGYGVRIVREDQPATIMIGERRMAIRKHRWIRGRTRRDESGEEVRVGDTIQREHFVIQVIPTGKYDSGIEGFVGGYRLRVRYSSLKEKVRGQGSQKLIVYEGVSRQRPIKVRVKGSDGYQAAWTEQPAEGTNSYTGLLETGPVVPAEFDVRDFVEIEGYFPAAREAEDVWMSVKDEVEVEFVRS